MAKDAALYADHVLEAIGYIEQDIAGCGFDQFRSERRLRQLIERNLEIISEASRRLPQELKATEPHIEWNAIAGIGNILRHNYHKGDSAIIWATCEKDLPPLKAAMARIKAAIKRDRK